MDQHATPFFLATAQQNMTKPVLRILPSFLNSLTLPGSIRPPPGPQDISFWFFLYTDWGSILVGLIRSISDLTRSHVRLWDKYESVTMRKRLHSIPARLHLINAFCGKLRAHLIPDWQSHQEGKIFWERRSKS